MVTEQKLQDDILQPPYNGWDKFKDYVLHTIRIDDRTPWQKTKIFFTPQQGQYCADKDALHSVLNI